MATKFSPCKRSYVLNQFPSNVMFGMNGFHVSASGAIQGHHGPLVIYTLCKKKLVFKSLPVIYWFIHFDNSCFTCMFLWPSCAQLCQEQNSVNIILFQTSPGFYMSAVKVF